MDKKGGFRIETYIIALVMFSLIIIVGVMMTNDINKNYGTNLMNESSSGFNNTFSNARTILDDTESRSGAMKDDIEGDIDDDSVEDSMFKGGFKAIRKIFSLISLPANVITDLQQALGLPDEFSIVVNIVFVILIASAILYLVFRFKPG